MSKVDEEEVPKTPAKKTATSQPIFQTPVSKIVGSSMNTPLAHTPGTHFQRQKAALTASLYAEYNKKVFGGKLDPAMTINWTNKLKTTAGRTLLKVRYARACVCVCVLSSVLNSRPAPWRSPLCRGRTREQGRRL